MSSEDSKEPDEETEPSEESAEKENEDEEGEAGAPSKSEDSEAGSSDDVDSEEGDSEDVDESEKEPEEESEPEVGGSEGKSEEETEEEEGEESGEESPPIAEEAPEEGEAEPESEAGEEEGGEEGGDEEPGTKPAAEEGGPGEEGAEGETPAPSRYIVQINPPPRRLGVDLTKVDSDWLPDAANSRIELVARIYAFKGGNWVFPGDARKITFTLKDVSKEKGICMNFPRDGNQNPDLFFAEDDDKMTDFDLTDDHTSGKPCPAEILTPNDNPAHSHHYQKATTKKAATEATVVVRCEDYGAFGTLSASAPDCETILPREKDDPVESTGSNDIKIPSDDNGNNIADSAPQDDGGAPGTNDNDSTPTGDGYAGDGLTNYEEYRGFIVKDGTAKKHIRTDITIKDVFIHDRDGLGTGMFNVSGLAFHLLPGADYYNGDSTNNNTGPDANRQIVNFNRGHSTGGIQHGLRLVNENRPGLYGISQGSGPGVPKVVNRVAINLALNTRATEPANRLSNTIGHELAHSVNVWHHGDLAQHNHGGINTDPTGGNTSGDTSCIMRYDNFVLQWCHPGTHPPPPHTHPVPAPNGDVVGTAFCTTPNGNGVNSIPGHFNNSASAGRGNCLNHFRVKDW